MEDDYCPEGYYKNAAPQLTMDGDYSDDEVSDDLGIDYSTDNVKAQNESAVDYQGLRQLLRNLGKSENWIANNLQPVEDASDQELNVRSENWQLEFRRPSNIRLFSHAFEWAGYSNYTKAVPKYQQFMSQTNKFTYYFTHQDGGRVYCSGFNEEGFLVTNRGIQDLSTGDTVQLDSIGAPDVSLQPESGEDDATETVKGIVEIASEQECIDSINGENLDPSDTGATRVVDVEDLEKIKDVIVSNVEQEIKVLPDESSVLFVHKDVVRLQFR